ncbi:telomere length regulation protein TEL2 homolog isoform X2 [Zootermopsis nevadensis]|nr:telomere length regulation protein TEL2 homolog isoform X2 [Zootermopsis nevadensis]
MWKVREIADKVTNVVMNYTEIEAKVREATNDDAWGPTGALMQEVAQGTFTYEHFPEVMTMLWKRMLQDNKKNWRRTYKSLLLLNYLVRNGSERVVTSAREHIYDLRSLENYTYVDEYGKDQGINVRHKVHELIDFIQDDDKLREERKKAKKNKDKYVGMSSDAMGMRFGGNSGWDDTPRWKKDEFGDWDPDKGGGISRGNNRHGNRNFEDMGNNSDDGDRYDSENEGGSHTRRGREYKDKDSDSLDSAEKREHSSKPSTPARTKPTTSVKKIDLGAAAHYGRGSNSLNSSPVKSNSNVTQQDGSKAQGDLLNDILGGNITPGLGDEDDFNPRASENSHASPGGEFGDFTSAFGKSASSKTSGVNDEFADFSSAFSEGVTVSSNTVGSSNQQFNSGTIGSTASIPSSNGIFGISQSDTDLLSDLGGVFTSVQPAALANNTAHSAILLTTNHNLNPLEATFTSPATQRCHESEGNMSLGTRAQDQDSHSLSSTVAVNPALQMPEENAECLDQFAREFKMSSHNNMEKKNQESFGVTNSISLKRKIYEVVGRFIALKVPDESGNMKQLIKSLTYFLPGPFTPQKFQGLDVPSSDLTQFYELHYRQVLEIILERYSPDWVDVETEVLISKLMVIDGSGIILFYEALHVLARTLRDAKGPSQKLDFVIDVLEKVVQSESMVSAVLDHCSVRNVSSERKPNFVMVQNRLDEIWEEVVQLLISLPSRVSNKIKYASKDTFVPDLYCKILCCHIAKCVQFLFGAVHKKCIPLKSHVLSVLMSKLIINFNDDRKSVGLLALIKIFEHWCSCSTYHTVVQNMFLNLHHEAVVIIARMILEKCSSPSAVYNILGNIVRQSQTWKHILCTKMLLMSYHEWEDSTFVENLIGCLAYMHFENLCRKATSDVPVVPSGGMLIDVLVNLLTVWGDGSALNHTPLEQHIYITQAIILCIHYLQVSHQTALEAEKICERCALKECDRKLIESKLFLGIPVHLESPFEPVRAIGMITAEIIVSILHKNDEPKLKFEYEDLRKDAESIVKALKKLGPTKIVVEVKGQQDSERCDFQNKTDCSRQIENVDIVLGNDLLCHLESECGLALAVKDDKNLNMNVDVNVDTNGEIDAGKSVYVTSETGQMKHDSDDTLDSDDDLIPYDMSGDVKVSAKKRPRYLRDLRDGLLETEDCERFSESLEICESLILSQLPDDDISLGIELLEILVCLEEKFCTDNFDGHRYSACVAILSTFPESCAEYLCSQFNTGFGKYSIGQRLFMLDCLAGAARKLSNLQVPIPHFQDKKDTKHPQFGTGMKLNRKQNTKENFVPNTLSNSAKDIVRRRIESHTRRFVSAPKPPPVGEANKFSAVAGSFFFPLLYGFNSNFGESCFLRNSYTDHNCLLLVHFLHTIAIVMTSSINCPLSVRMGKELMDLCWMLRYHSQAKVRLAVMGCVGAVVIAVPKSILLLDLYESLLECRLWLLEVMKTGLRQGDPDSDCREFAAHLLALIGNLIGENLLASDFVNTF